ncbi:hypothetical protein BKA67DRAFT_657815 [Truncatella angustata]|uniref:Ketoreductase domain-containing protein n=1 Tax=Truncatella angustata TaxID=152316 RepID=A0A9P9A0E0_9PEZI|nr:uncharacterized protein BKA67DRAFT_657815 [Truncatella angustata]KAH6655914.1 hypothetical protein BKA67DRAFT_657815 [Truncatella angustata]
MASADAYTAPFMLTKSMHRDVYPAVDPKINPELDGSSKVVMIFGATSGLGYAIAKSWSIARARGIVLVGRNRGDLENVKKDLATDSEVLVIAANVTSVSETDAAFETALGKFGRVDVVINAFGVMKTAPIGAQDPGAWWENFDTNVRGVYNVCHSYINAAGGKGTIVNLVSLAASFVAPAMSGYSASKLAVIKLGECLQVEQPGIRVFSVHPGMVVADSGRGMIIEAFAPFTKDTAALTGGLTLFLATPRADFLNGGYIHANWDVRELEHNKKEIVEKKLVALGFLNGQLREGGYPWTGV